jgi:transketolase
VQHVRDANDVEALEHALRTASAETHGPSLIIVDSHIAFGAPTKQDTHAAHGEPLGEEEIRAAKKAYGWDPDKKFYVPEEVQAYCKEVMVKGKTAEEEWRKKFAAYAAAHPDLAEHFTRVQRRELPRNWQASIPSFPADAKGIASRESSGKVLNAIAEQVPWLLGGSADLAPSTKTLLKGAKSFQKNQYDGRNLHFGIREHAMAAILNGMALSKLRPYGATFLVFSDYMRPSLRLSALMEQPAIYIFTHDSIGVGEDGPTHQPVEHLASLRAIHHLDVIRPADANEVAVLWQHIMNLHDRPAALILTRQATPTFDRTKYASAEGALRGAYVLADSGGAPEIILIGTGSEVQLCLGAYEQLQTEGVCARVVSMPCWELYERQDASYWEEVLPSLVRARVAVEAGSTFGWRRYVGRHGEGEVLGMRTYGASAPIKDLLKEFGLTVESVVQAAKKVLARVKRG